MKKIEICNLLNKFDIDLLVNQNVNPNKIYRKISKELGETKSPSRAAIKTYIKNKFHVHWDKKIKAWISYQNNKNSNTKDNKKSSPKVAENITILHESEINEVNSNKEIEEVSSCSDTETSSKIRENSPPKGITNTPFTETKNNEKYTTNLPKLKDESIPTEEYAEYITALGTEKYSLSLSCFIVELLEQRISKKYNLKRKGNRSKLVQIAMTEYLRLTK